MSSIVAATDASLWITGLMAASGGVASLVSIISLFTTRRELELVKSGIGTEIAAISKRVTAMEEDVRDLKRELPEMERRMQAASETRAVDLHERINQVLAAVSELRGRIHERGNH